jgi:hypothetical protein
LATRKGLVTAQEPRRTAEEGGYEDDETLAEICADIYRRRGADRDA